MLLILSLGLLPLGLVAILAAIQSAAENSERRHYDTEVQVEIKAQRLDSALSRSALTIRAASDALTQIEDGVQTCRNTLIRLVRGQSVPSQFALFAGRNEPLCNTRGFEPAPELMESRGRRSAVEISPDAQSLRFALYDTEGRLEGIGEFPRESLVELSGIAGPSSFNLELVQGERRMELRHDIADHNPLFHNIEAEAPVADNRLQLRMAVAVPPLTPAEMLMMALPLLMWAWALVIVWFIVSRALLRPLVRMKKAVVAYKPGEKDFHMPKFRTPALEIVELGTEFDRVTQTVAHHETELEAAVERQTKLVREVHHRVKNNLQVVASLLNLHARGNRDEAVAAAYASIQRRVDALAVVHRNHYAELEENRGVSLRSLIAELGSNLRAGAPAAAASMAVRVDIDPYYASQDVAVPVAFLITEIVEYAMLCGARQVTILLEARGPDRARLTISSDSLKGEADCDSVMTERFERIVTGLSRQLRTTVDRDLIAGSFSLEIKVNRADPK